MFTLAKIIETKPKPPIIEIDPVFNWINPLTFTAEEPGSTVALLHDNKFNIYFISGTADQTLADALSANNLINSYFWNYYETNNKITLNSIGDWVAFGNDSITLNNNTNFQLTGKLKASGSVQSLVNDKATWNKYKEDWERDENGNIIHSNLTAGNFSRFI